MGHYPAHVAACWDDDAQTRAAFGAGSRRAGLLHGELTARRGVTLMLAGNSTMSRPPQPCNPAFTRPVA